jgi:UDPglucose 6-dehydrogenase
MLEAVDEVNDCQKHVLIEKLKSHFGGKLNDKTVALWGLAFKPRTDDIREAPALTLIDFLVAEGAKVQVHDPEAMANIRKIYGEKISYFDLQMPALVGADALCIMTEWNDYKRPKWDEMMSLMRSPAVFDGRNLYDPERMQSLGFKYYSIGRSAV